MYHARFKNTYYEAGFRWGKRAYEHGSIIKEQPTFSIDEKRKRFARSCLPIVRTIYPDLLEEIRGIADGQNMAYEDLYSFILSMYCFELANHCSCFVCKQGNQIVFGRNSDFLVSLEKLTMNCKYALDGVLAFNGNTTAFVEIEDGVNEKGLAIGLTFVYPRTIHPGLNGGLLVRYCLEHFDTVEQVIDWIQTVPIASTQTLSVADRNGNMVVIECDPRHVEIIRPQNENFICATNFFTSAVFENEDPTDFDDWKAHERYDTLDHALRQKEKGDLIDFSKDLLAGRYGYLCQYDRKQNRDTVWSVIYDLTFDRILRCEGNPSRKKFIEKH